MRARLQRALLPAPRVFPRPSAGLVRAAVLIPLIEQSDGLRLLLTKRTDHLEQHPGQISFPGGRRDAGEENPVDTALREAREEVGLEASLVSVAGALETYETVTGFSISPIVGWVDPRAAFDADPREVDEIFEVALARVLDPGNFERQSVLYKGEERGFWVLRHPRHFIWGATAGMLHRLCRRYGEAS